MIEFLQDLLKIRSISPKDMGCFDLIEEELVKHDFNEVKISIGENCLLGANAGIGISLGNNCIVEAGLYVTSGTKVHIMDAENKASKVVKAKDISGESNLLFMRDSVSGKVIAKENHRKSSLNKELHKND
jgi:2,3,4,5-tetrahydropyridine-2-carboxylate N-succinyltransferase